MVNLILYVNICVGNAYQNIIFLWCYSSLERMIILIWNCIFFTIWSAISWEFCLGNKGLFHQQNLDFCSDSNHFYFQYNLLCIQIGNGLFHYTILQLFNSHLYAKNKLFYSLIYFLSYNLWSCRLFILIYILLFNSCIYGFIYERFICEKFRTHDFLHAGRRANFSHEKLS